MKVGDLVRRKDMPELVYKIVGESEKWDMWEVRSRSQASLINAPKKSVKSTGMIQKNDERWEVVEGEL